MGIESDRVHSQICGSVINCIDNGKTAEERGNADRPLRIIVPYTTPELTKAALSGASGLAADLQAETVLLAVREIPYRLPLDRPDFRPAFLLEQLKALTNGISCPVRIELVLARSKSDVFGRILGPGAVVVIATRRHWWRTGEERLARSLSRAGCSVSLLILEPGERGVVARQIPPAASSASRGVAESEVSHA